jgi:hypothetical protein
MATYTNPRRSLETTLGGRSTDGSPPHSVPLSPHAAPGRERAVPLAQVAQELLS